MGSILLGVLLVVVGAVLVLRHRAVWKLRAKEFTSAALPFHLKQYYRRSQASGLIVLIGLYFLAGNFVVDPYWQVAYWSLVAILVACLMILAMVDLFSTRRHYAQLQDDYVAQRAKLESEATRLQHADLNKNNGHNGHPRS